MDSNKNQEFIFINPVFKQVIWGGDRLATEWGYDIPGSNTGECWAVSAHPNGDCTIKGGIYAGKTLSQLWLEEPKLFGNMEGDKFPLLIKIIDAKADLSIQVHPDDAYAVKNENGFTGKAECWYILDAPENAALVIGHNAKNKDELADMIHNERWEELLREVPVKKGDFIQIDPGTVHAIKGGVELLETQQNSDITYRMYDYGRLVDGKPRELHLDKSIDVVTVPAKPVEDVMLCSGEPVKNQMNLLISCEAYCVWRLDIDESIQFIQKYPFLIMSVLEGEGYINGRSIRKGDHFIVPYNFGEVEIQGRLNIITSTVA